MKPTIYFATDHAGVELKNELLSFVKNDLLYEVIDCGAFAYDVDDDFTDFIPKAVKEVSKNPTRAKAIILGGSGQGEAMLANAFPHVRAVVYYGGDEKIITLSREHNNANVLSLGARFLDTEEARQTVQLWLETEHVPTERYDRRLAKMETISHEVSVTESLSFAEQEESSSIGKVNNVSYSRIRTIVPSLPAESFQEVKEMFDTFIGISSGIQIDIVDGVFVPHVSWPFTELQAMKELSQLKPFADKIAIEIDCMCMSPETYLDTFVSIGVSRVIIHEGTTEVYERCFKHARSHGYKIGLGILNSTPLSFVAEFIHDIDFVQVMGIAHIGIQGQEFDTKTLNTVALLCGLYPDLEIAVDGAVNADTIVKLKNVGVTRFAPGSAITKSINKVTSYKQLEALIRT